MPLYAYYCPECGEFSSWRAIAQRNNPAPCPYCETASERVLTAPGLSLMTAARRQAFARNEKSCHEPGVKTRHRCGAGCGCGSSTQAPKSTRTVDLGKAGRFETSLKRKRPWMLGH